MAFVVPMSVNRAVISDGELAEPLMRLANGDSGVQEKLAPAAGSVVSVDVSYL